MTPDSNKAFIHWSASGEEADKGLHDDFYGMNLLLFDPKVRAFCRRKSFVSDSTTVCRSAALQRLPWGVRSLLVICCLKKLFMSDIQAYLRSELQMLPDCRTASSQTCLASGSQWRLSAPHCSSRARRQPFKHKSAHHNSPSD